MNFKEYFALSKTEAILRLRFDISKETVLYPMFLHQQYAQWEHYWAADTDRYFKAVPGKTPREIRGHIDSDGYRQITANSRTVRDQAHRIQYRLFSGRDIPDGFVVHHINGRRLDNTVLNLVAMHPDEHRRLPRLQYRRLTEEEIAIAVALAETGMKVAQIAKTMDVTHRQVADLLRRNHVAKPVRASVVAFNPKTDKRDGPEHKPLYGPERRSPRNGVLSGATDDARSSKAQTSKRT